MHGTMKLQSLVWYIFNLAAPLGSPGRSTISYIGLNKIWILLAIPSLPQQYLVEKKPKFVVIGNHSPCALK